MSNRESSQPWQAWIIAILAGLLMFGIIYLLPGFWFDYSASDRYDHVTLSEVSERTHIEFPPGSRLLNGKGISFLHTNLWIRVEMRAQDVDPFLESLNKWHPINLSRKVKLANDMAVSPIRQDKRTASWWKPDSAVRFISAKSAITPGSGGTEIALVIDLDRPDKAVMYLIHFQD